MSGKENLDGIGELFKDEKNLSFLLKRINDEVEELDEAYRGYSIQRMKEECADVSNLIDFLFEELIQMEMKALREKKKE